MGRSMRGPDPLKAKLLERSCSQDWYFEFLKLGIIDIQSLTEVQEFILERPAIYAFWEGMSIVYVGMVKPTAKCRLKLWRKNPLCRYVSIIPAQPGEMRVMRQFTSYAIEALQPRLNLEGKKL